MARVAPMEAVYNDLYINGCSVPARRGRAVKARAMTTPVELTTRGFSRSNCQILLTDKARSAGGLPVARLDLVE
jgi:hypothetical protein